MRKRKMFRSVAILSVIMLSASIYLSGCGKQSEPEPLMAEPAVEATEPEESLSENKPEESEVEEKEEVFTLTQMDIQKLVNTQAYTYDKPTNQSEIVGVAQKDEIVHVIAQVDGTNWFKIEQGGGEDDIIVMFIGGAYLSEYTAPEPETSEEKLAETPAETQKPAESQKPAEKPAETQKPSQPQQQQPPAEPSEDSDMPIGWSIPNEGRSSGDTIYGGKLDI